MTLLSDPQHAANVRLAPQSVGLQHLGYAPGGALDRYSLMQAVRLLGTVVNKKLAESELESMELVWTDRVEVQAPAWITLTGAPREATINGVRIRHATTYWVQAGDWLAWREARCGGYGFRSYLSAVSASGNSLSGYGLGVTRGPLSALMQWQQPRKIRVLAGPEFDWVEHRAELLDAPWRIGPDSNRMGLRINRLQGGLPLQLNRTADDMISQPVNDGTVQFTPAGLIILLRDRQTVGGYPRVLNVISADVDLLAHYRPGQLLHFEWVDEAQALMAAQIKQSSLDQWSPQTVSLHATY